MNCKWDNNLETLSIKDYTKLLQQDICVEVDFANTLFSLKEHIRWLEHFIDLKLQNSVHVPWIVWKVMFLFKVLLSVKSSATSKKTFVESHSFIVNILSPARLRLVDLQKQFCKGILSNIYTKYFLCFPDKRQRRFLKVLWDFKTEMEHLKLKFYFTLLGLGVSATYYNFGKFS